MHEYEFVGAVKLFDRIVANNYVARTTAPSARKARANITYRYKRENGLAPNAKITLSGTITVVEEQKGNCYV